MKKKLTTQSPRLSATYKRAIVIMCAVLVLLLVGYAEIIRPNQDANAYIAHLDTNSKPLEKCFEDLSKTTELKVYYAPDISLEQKRQDTATILKQITTCRAELKTFNTKSHDLVNLHLSGYTNSYQQAKTYQRQAYDVVGQSNDVLDQYAQLATFLSSYYDHLIAFKTYSQELQDNKYYLGTAQLATMQQQADDLRERSAQIRELDAPAEFSTTKTSTADMFTNAAVAFDNVIKGYRYGNDYTVALGYDELDKANADYDGSVINLPFEQLIKSYIPQQVNQLPSKVSNLLSTEAE
jgi:hypothetical protein